jgi:hypothetical protein
MKNKVIITLSGAGLLALFAIYIGLHTALLRQAVLRHYPAAFELLLDVGFALSFLATVLAATSFARHWRAGGVIGLLIWCFAVMAAYAGMLAFGF